MRKLFDIYSISVAIVYHCVPLCTIVYYTFLAEESTARYFQQAG